MNLSLMNVLRSSKPVLYLTIILFISACASQKNKDAQVLLPEPYLAQPNNGLVYNASFKYKDYQASGLLVMKRLEKSTYHVVLLSKFGPSLMEFKLYQDSISWVKSFEQLRKQSIEKLIERDFRLLLQSNLDHVEKVKQLKDRKGALVLNLQGTLKSRIRLDPETLRVIYAENRQTVNPVKTKVYFRYYQQPFPDSISLVHTNVDMSLQMNLLKINHATK